jgi:hypothetical protein
MRSYLQQYFKLSLNTLTSNTANQQEIHVGKYMLSALQQIPFVLQNNKIVTLQLNHTNLTAIC